MNPIAQGYYYGFAGNVGANPVERELPAPTRHGAGGAALAALGDVPAGDPDVLELDDSRTYSIVIHSGDLITNAAIQGAGDQRPYVLVSSDDAGTDNAANLRPADPTADPIVPPGTRTLRIEGAWLGSADDLRHEFIIERATNPGDGFDWDEILLREATFDPGGVRGDESEIAPLRILVRGRVKTLRIERSIIGPIRVEQVPEDCENSGFVEELVIEDSIIDAQRFEPSVAIECPTGRVELRRVTVFGDVDVTLLEASDSIIVGTLNVLNQQESCLRFSAVSPTGILPRQFECFGPPRPSENVPATPIVGAFFTSLRFGDPGYATLSVIAPAEIVTGAESGSEMGAFSGLLRPIHLASIVNKVDEFKPAGVIAQYILEGEHTANFHEELP